MATTTTPNVIKGTRNGDKLNGTTKDDQIYGYEGNDTITGGAGNDLLDGGLGNDNLRGGAGNDTYVVDSASDLVTELAGEGVDSVQSSVSYVLGANVENLALTGTLAINGTGNSLNNSISGNGAANVLNGAAGNDTLTGGAGNDQLLGGTGSDTYVYAGGDGSDLITEAANGGDLDTLVLATGITPDQVSLARVGTDLVVRLAGGGEVKVAGQFAGTGIEQIQFANGTLWGAAQFDQATWEITGSAGNDFLAGHAGKDVFQGRAGDDQLAGNLGSDTYVFAAGDGRDTILEAANGNGDVDTLVLGAGITPDQVLLARVGNDLVLHMAYGEEVRVAGQYAGAGIEQIQFANGTVWGAAELDKASWELVGTANGDFLAGHAGEDRFFGLGGDDTLAGDLGSDTYYVDAFAGNDVVFEAANGVGEMDTLVLGAGIAESQVQLLRVGNDLMVRIQGTDNEVRVAGQYAGRGIEQIVFTDGSVWSSGAIELAPWEVTGTAGYDLLHGHDGQDILAGLAGDDQLMGDLGSDIYLFGRGEGSDTIFEAGNNADIDTVQLGTGITPEQVTLIRSGNDLVLRLDSGEELLVVGQFSGAGAGIESIIFESGTHWNPAAIDQATWEITGTAGYDFLHGHDGRDILVGGAGDDQLMGDAGSDSYVFAKGDGKDAIFESYGNPDDADTLVLGAGITTDQVSLVRSGQDLLVRFAGGEDEVRVVGQYLGAGVEQIRFADGSSWGAYEFDQATWEVTGTAGYDFLHGHDGQDILAGGAGDDQLMGDLGSDTYVFARGDGKDAIFEAFDNPVDGDTLALGAGITTDQVSLLRTGPDLLVRIAGSEDEVRVVGQYSGGGIEQIKFADGTIWGAYELDQAVWELTGTAGDDFLHGHQSQDILQGQAGDDQLMGDLGSDTYVFARGDGKDAIFETYGNSGDADTLLLGAGITTDQVSLVRSGQDLLVRFAGGDDEVRVVGQYNGAGIEQIKFADGASWGAYELDQATWEVGGTAGEDFLWGHDGKDVLLGLAGNDQLMGNAGSDTYVFAKGDGKDSIFETYDNPNDGDTLVLGAGITTDQVSLLRSGPDLVVRLADSGDEVRVVGQYSGSGIEQIRFANGDAWGRYEFDQAAWEVTGTAGDDFLMGHAGEDIFQGQAGDDLLLGQEGNDTYVFAKGDGKDAIVEAYDTPWEGDVLSLAAGITPDQVSLVRAGADLLVRFAGSDDEVRVSGQFQGSGIEQIRFANGDAWGRYEFDQAAWEVTGTAGDDFLMGHAGEDIFQGQAGDDLLLGQEDNDTYVFAKGDGKDTIVEAYDTPWEGDVLSLAAGITPDQVSLVRAGADLLVRFAGSDDEVRVSGQFQGSGIEQIRFANGDAWGRYEFDQAAWEVTGTAGDDYLMGHAGKDIFQGQAGDDLLLGQEDNDTYVFAKGDGKDTIVEAYDTPWEGDVLSLAAGITPDQVSLVRAGADLLVRFAGSDDEVRVSGQFQGSGIEQIRFANGDAWGRYEFDQAAWEVTGTAGDDYLMGHAGKDVFQGQAGDDLLLGQEGNDTYVFAKGDGKDTIVEAYDTPWEGDVLSLAAGITPDQVSLVRAGADLLVRFAGSDDEVRVSGQFQGSGIEQIRFANGDAWGRYEFDQAAWEVTGTAGDDYVMGHAGKDIFQGQAGDDLLLGQEDNDTYVFAKGDGKDTIVEAYDTPWEGDVLSLAAGITPDQVSLVRAGADLLVRFAGSTDEVRVSGQFQGTGIEQIRFANGDAWGRYEFDQAAWEVTGTADDDYLMGHAGKDIFQGQAGDDLLLGQEDNDTYVFAKGDGKDTIVEAYDTPWEGDVLSLAAGITPDQVSLVRAGADLLVRFAGSTDEVRVSGQFQGSGIEQIRFANGDAWGRYELDQAAWEVTGTAGDDYLMGHDGRDTLVGLAGNDQLMGNLGSDTYFFAKGDGKDSILEAYGNPGDTDILVLGAGITTDQVSLVRSGQDLVVRISGTTDEVRIAGQYYGGGIEQIRFANGAAWGASEFSQALWEVTGTIGDDFLWGHAGNDLMQGLAGNDQLMGDMGSDVYVFGYGDGKDLVMEPYNYGDTDTVRLGAGITTSQLNLVRSGADLVLRLAGSSDEMRIAGHFNGGGIEKIQFANGTVWTQQDIDQNSTWELVGTAYSDYLQGHYGKDSFQGLGGDDQMRGDMGSDTYVFAAGDGKDVVFEGYNTYGENDTLRFTTGISPDLVTLVRSGSDMVAKLYGSGDEVRLVGQYAGSGIETMQFANGTAWGAAQFSKFSLERLGTSLNNSLGGTSAAEVFIPGAGSDQMYGDVGSDTYVFNMGDGRDLVFEERNDRQYGDVDVVRLGPGITPTQVTMNRMGYDLVIRNIATGDELRVVDNYYDMGVEKVVFANGGYWDKADISKASYTTVTGPADLTGVLPGNDFYILA